MVTTQSARKRMLAEPGDWGVLDLSELLDAIEAEAVAPYVARIAALEGWLQAYMADKLHWPDDSDSWLDSARALLAEPSGEPHDPS